MREEESPVRDGDVVWARVDRDFYVANAPGEFIGCVDCHDKTFQAYDPYTELIGSYATLKAAMSAVVEKCQELAVR